jgi:hypothetical protein
LRLGGETNIDGFHAEDTEAGARKERAANTEGAGRAEKNNPDVWFLLRPGGRKTTRI